ncbi:PHT4H [Auxenochlorella protothecoides x Auxenochlorella symbiontica]
MAPVLPPNTRPTSPLAPTPRFWRPPPASILRQASDRVDALHVSGHPSSVAVEAVGELRLPWTRAAYALTWRGLTALVSLAVALFAAHASLLAVAIIPMAARYGWDPASQGVLLSASYSGQLCSQLAGGLLADRWGGRAPLAAGVVASSLASLLTPVATAGGRGGLVVVRVLLGLAQGAATPAVHSLLSAHCPPARQTTAAAAVAAATLFGTALVFGAAPPLLARAPWQLAFYLAGGAALAWLAPWAALALAPGPRAPVAPTHFTLGALWRGLAPHARQGMNGGVTPRDAPPAGLAPIAEEGADRARAGRLAAWIPGWPGWASPMPGPGPLSAEQSDDGLSEAGTDWSDGVATAHKARLAALPSGFAALLRQREVWAICVAQFAGSWGAYGLLSWLPSFFRDAYGVELARLGRFAVLPYAVQGCVGLAAGAAADRLLARGWATASVRRGAQAAGMLGPAACILAAAACRGPGAAAAWITLGAAAGALAAAGAGANHLDVAPKHAGLVWGAGSSAATAAGLLAVPVSGVVLEATGSWAAVFGLAAAIYALGAGLYWVWAGGEALLADG